MKRVLVIAYYFPPMGLSGVQRTLKFVKYLPEFGWRPTVLTVNPHSYFAFDDHLLAELQHRDVEIWRTDPGGLFALAKGRRTVSLNNEGLRKVLSRVSQAVFIPDNKIGWKNKALRFLAVNNMAQFDAVFSTAPPFTDHLLALDVKRRYGLPVALDFRDAWLEYPYHHYVTSWHRNRHLRLEARAVGGADAVIATNDHVADLLKSRHGRGPSDNRFHVLTQGFDPEDFVSGPDADSRVNPDEVNFVFSGIFYEDRDPVIVYQALAAVKASNPEIYRRLRFFMIGYVQEEFRRVADRMGVADRFVYCGYLEHHQAVSWLSRADALWFNIGSRSAGFQTVAPGKAFEYIGSGRPIVAIVPENHIRSILAEFPHTFIIEPDGTEQLARTFVEIAERKASGTLPVADSSLTARFDRRHLTGLLGEILTGISAYHSR